MSRRQLENPMSRHVFSLPDLIEQQYEDLVPKVQDLLSTEEISNTKKIILTGCADSFAAVSAVKDAFASLTDISVELVTTLDFSRFYPESQLGFAGNNPLVICFSNSGRTSRISEVAQRAQKHGCFVLGVTGNDNSDLAKYSNEILKIDIPEFEEAPAVRSYLVGILALLLIGIRMGESKGIYSIEEAKNMRLDIKNRGNVLRKNIDGINEASLTIPNEMKDLRCFDFLGGGRDYATAMVGQIQFLEAVGFFAICNNTEDWAHTNIFMKNPEQIGTFMIAGKRNSAFSRNKEVAHYINELGRPFVIITDGDKTDFDNAEGFYIKIPSAKYEINDVLLNFVPLALIASYIGEMISEKYGRGSEGKWKFTQNGYPVKDSEIIVL